MTPEDKKQVLTTMRQELIKRGKKIDELHMALLEYLTTRIRINSFPSFLSTAVRLIPGIVDPLVNIIGDVERNIANMMSDMQPQLDQMATLLYKRLQKGNQRYSVDHLAQLNTEEKNLLAFCEEFDPESVNPSKMRLSEEEIQLLEMFGGSSDIRYDPGKLICDAVGKEDNIPEEYLCPISLCIMEDPVIIPETLQTYDRASIESHFKYSTAKSIPLLCPLTNVNVSGILIPNDALRDKIRKWSKNKIEEKAPAPQLTDKSLTF